MKPRIKLARFISKSDAWLGDTVLVLTVVAGMLVAFWVATAQ